MLLNPACALFVCYYAYVYSMIYVYLVALPLLYAKHDPPTRIFSYNWPAGTAGLNYISLGVGFLSAAFVAATYADRIYKYCSRRYNNNGQPEYRLVITQVRQIVAGCRYGRADASYAPVRHALLPSRPSDLGVDCSSANPLHGPHHRCVVSCHRFWVAANAASSRAGSSIFSFGLMLTFNSIQNWIVDAFQPYSAAAMAAASLARSITGCILPVFADAMFLNLGYGWGGTLLALVSVVRVVRLFHLVNARSPPVLFAACDPSTLHPLHVRAADSGTMGVQTVDVCIVEYSLLDHTRLSMHAREERRSLKKSSVVKVAH